LLGSVVRELETLRTAYPDVTFRGLAALPNSARGMAGRNAAASDSGVIGLNKAFWKSVQKLESGLEEGWQATAPGYSAARTTIIHEFGHLVDYHYFSGLAGGRALPVVSDYARKNFLERWAEAFVEYHTGAKTPAANWVRDRLRSRIR
jgi:hypothetical protein